jgi:hypothetical protein
MSGIRADHPFVLASGTFIVAHLAVLSIRPDAWQKLQSQLVESILMSGVAIAFFGAALHNLRCHARGERDKMWTTSIDDSNTRLATPRQTTLSWLFMTLGFGFGQILIYLS